MIECLMNLETGRLATRKAWVTFASPDGEERLLPVGWLGIVCSRPPRLSFRLHGGETGDAGFLSGSSFGINLAPSSGAFDADALEGGILMAAAPASPPLLTEYPVRIECRGAAFDGDSRLGMVSGEVLAVHMGEVCYGLEPENPLGPIRPFVRDWRRHLRPAAPVGGGCLDRGVFGGK